MFEMSFILDYPNWRYYYCYYYILNKFNYSVLLLLLLYICDWRTKKILILSLSYLSWERLNSRGHKVEFLLFARHPLSVHGPLAVWFQVILGIF